MKVLFLTVEWPFPSQPSRAPFVYNLAQSLLRQGIELTIYPCQIKRSLPRFYRYRRQISRLLADNDFDHVHVYGLISSLLLAKKFEKEASISLIGSDILGIVKSNGKYSLLSKLFIRQYFSRLRNFAGIRCVSRQLYNKVKQFDHEEIEFLITGNGVSKDVFRPISRNESRKKLNWMEDCYHIFFPSNSSRPVKNFALANRIVDYGNGLSGKRMILHRTSNLPQVKMNELYRASDLVLVTSHHEGSPNVVKESLWCGAPLLSTNVGDVSMQISHFSYGSVFEATDQLDSIVEKMRTLLECPRQDVHLPSSYALENLSNDIVAGKLISLFEACRNKI